LPVAGCFESNKLFLVVVVVVVVKLSVGDNMDGLNEKIGVGLICAVG
jgi:hypothetical protein